MAKKNEPAGTPEENECPDNAVDGVEGALELAKELGEPVLAVDCAKSVETGVAHPDGSFVSHDAPVPIEITAADELIPAGGLLTGGCGITACAPIQGDLRLEPGSIHHSFFKALIENDTHGWLEAQGVNPKAGLDPATVLAIAKTLCSILGPVCAAISSL